MSDYSIPEIAGKIFELLEPLDSDDRKRVVSGCMAMLGEDSIASNSRQVNIDTAEKEDPQFGRKAARWMKQNQLNLDHLEEVFHFHGDGTVEVLEIDVPGSNKRQKTLNAYLLVGAAALLANDTPTMSENEVVDFCKRVGCHDSSNHAGTRDMLGNRTTGSKQSGFTLTVPGQKEAADVIKSVSAG